MEKLKDEKKEKKRRWKKILLALLLLLNIVVLIVGLYFLTNNLNQVDIDPNAEDYVSSLKRPDDIDSSQILIPGYGELTMEKGSNTLETTLFNPEDNPCYFRFTLVDAETEEVLYESKLVPPGKGISPITLNKTFDEEGTYSVILKYETVDLEDTSINYNGSEVELTIKVE